MKLLHLTKVCSLVLFFTSTFFSPALGRPKVVIISRDELLDTSPEIILLRALQESLVHVIGILIHVGQLNKELSVQDIARRLDPKRSLTAADAQVIRMLIANLNGPDGLAEVYRNACKAHGISRKRRMQFPKENDPLIVRVLLQIQDCLPPVRDE